MSGTALKKRQRIDSTKGLASIVHTMKVLAASKIDHYEESVRALEDYYRTITLGLSICLRNTKVASHPLKKWEKEEGLAAGAVVFGSDLGLVGQFNEKLSEFVVEKLAGYPGPLQIWAVGERVYTHLLNDGLPVVKMYRIPNTTKGITPLVGKLLLNSRNTTFYVFHNQLKTQAAYEPVMQKMLPLDEHWIQTVGSQEWITDKLPEVLPHYEQTLSALIREYLFVSLFKACTESQAAENTTRLSAMQRAEKNISELLKDLQQSYHRARQNAIDAELFDIIAGFEALKDEED